MSRARADSFSISNSDDFTTNQLAGIQPAAAAAEVENEPAGHEFTYIK